MPEAETWATALERLACLLGGRSERYRTEAEEWLRQTITARWQRGSLHDLTRSQRGAAFRHLLAVVSELADEGEIAFTPDLRALVAAAFARHFATDRVDGPAWRIAPAELDHPTYAEATDDSLPL